MSSADDCFTLYTPHCFTHSLACVVCSLDNSDWMRNGDYIPTRLNAQQDAGACATPSLHHTTTALYSYTPPLFHFHSVATALHCTITSGVSLSHIFTRSLAHCCSLIMCMCTASLICTQRTDSHPESTVGLLTMAGKGCVHSPSLVVFAFSFTYSHTHSLVSQRRGARLAHREYR